MHKTTVTGPRDHVKPSCSCGWEGLEWYSISQGQSEAIHHLENVIAVSPEPPALNYSDLTVGQVFRNLHTGERAKIEKKDGWSIVLRLLHAHGEGETLDVSSEDILLEWNRELQWK